MTHSHSNITVFSNLDALSSILCCYFIDLCDRRRSINFTRLIADFVTHSVNFWHRFTANAQKRLFIVSGQKSDCQSLKQHQFPMRRGISAIGWRSIFLTLTFDYNFNACHKSYRRKSLKSQTYLQISLIVWIIYDSNNVQNGSFISSN